jgi:hypothetical protein
VTATHARSGLSPPANALGTGVSMMNTRGIAGSAAAMRISSTTL